MAITKWAPFDAFTSLEHEFHSLMERMGILDIDDDWKPTCDVFRENGDVIVKAELPGVDPKEGLKVEVVEGVLRIRGEVESDTGKESEGLFLHERRFGSFRRDIPLPEGVDVDKILGSFDNGVLTVRVALPEEGETSATPIEIPIKA